MQIKRFEAVDMQEALRLVKGELGPDAVILSTKQIRKDNGVFGMFSRQVVEVVAARDYTDKQHEKEPIAGRHPGYFETDDFLKEEFRKIRDDIRAAPGELKDMKAELGLLKGYIQELLREGEQEQLKSLHDNIAMFFRRLVSEGMDRHIAYRLVQILNNKLTEEQKNDMDEINRYGMELIQKQVKTTGPLFN